MQVLVYTRIKNSSETFIYIQKAGQFSRSKTICVTCLFTKIPIRYVTPFFLKVLKLRFIYIQNAWHFSLHDVLYSTIPTVKKKKAICVTFLPHKKPDTFCYAIFQFFVVEIIGGGGGHLYM